MKTLKEIIEEAKERFREKYRTFAGKTMEGSTELTHNEARANLEKELTLALTSFAEGVKEEIEKKVIVPVEVPHHNPYLTGYNTCIVDVLTIINNAVQKK